MTQAGRATATRRTVKSSTAFRTTGEVAKALGDPIRLQLVDVLRKHAGKVCVCELVPLFEISQPTLSHHLKKLREAGLITSERRGTWVYCRVAPGVLPAMAQMLSPRELSG